MSNIHGLNADDDDRPPRHSHSGSDSANEDEDRQGFFVGGSVRSGQQVLGPNRRDLDSHLFNAIQRAGAERLTPEQVEALGRQQQSGSNSSNRFSGGFRLGGNGVESGPIGGGNVAPTAAAAATNVGNNSNRPPQQVVWNFFEFYLGRRESSKVIFNPFCKLNTFRRLHTKLF
ncbi:unnamed protein product [Meloidogyne enterolobii]|uniref:Uncharacterized protein n=1 Tax=Meloidogyne enterolobii TaxID=390850 RepID=A0ACB1A7L3_MELEN